MIESQRNLNEIHFMDWCKVDLNLLKVLAVMLEERSVARCADRLFVSPLQSATTRSAENVFLGSSLCTHAGRCCYNSCAEPGTLAFAPEVRF